MPRLHRCLLRVVALSIVAPFVCGQDSAPSTTGDAAIPVRELELNLMPLTKDQLIIEATAWQGLLQAKVQELSSAEILAGKTEGAEQTQHLTAATALRDERVALGDRLRVVLAELAEKGGDVKEYELYIAAVSGLTVDVRDTSAAVETILGWLKSPEGGIRWAKNIAFFIVTLIAFMFLSRVAGGFTRRALAVSKVQTSDILKAFFIGMVRKLVFALGIVVALSMLEVNIGPFLAAMGVAGFVIGFALQGTLSNFAAGLMILLYRPYDMGDFISAGGVMGSVRSMSLVSTTLATPDNQNVVVPNGSIWGGVITNVTGNETRRIDLVFGIGYSDDIAKAESVLREIVTGHANVLPEPQPVVQVHELADSSVNFVCRPWVKTSDYWKVYWDLTRSVKERFDEAGINIPFPQRDVHLHQA